MSSGDEGYNYKAFKLENSNHNEISKRGREKINQQILRIQSFLPECQNAYCNKAAILEQAAYTLECQAKQTEVCKTELRRALEYNRQIEKEIDELMNRVCRTTREPQETLTSIKQESQLGQGTVEINPDEPLYYFLSAPILEKRRERNDLR